MEERPLRARSRGTPAETTQLPQKGVRDAHLTRGEDAAGGNVRPTGGGAGSGVPTHKHERNSQGGIWSNITCWGRPTALITLIGVGCRKRRRRTAVRVLTPGKSLDYVVRPQQLVGTPTGRVLVLERVTT